MVHKQLINHVLSNNRNKYASWESDRYGQLICPCGNHIEIDGNCPNGCISPVKQEGMI